MLPKLILGLFLYAGVCRQCRGDHLRTLGSTDADSEVQDPGLASTSHREPQIHEPSCSSESAEEIDTSAPKKPSIVSLTLTFPASPDTEAEFEKQWKLLLATTHDQASDQLWL